MHLKISSVKWRPFCPGEDVFKCPLLSFSIKNGVIRHTTKLMNHEANPPVPPPFQMETFSVLLAICAGNSPVPGEFPTQRPVTWSFDVFFDLRLNKQLSKQWWVWWVETLSRPLWRHRNVLISVSPRQTTILSSDSNYLYFNLHQQGVFSDQIAQLSVDWTNPLEHWGTNDLLKVLPNQRHWKVEVSFDTLKLDTLTTTPPPHTYRTHTSTHTY